MRWTNDQQKAIDGRNGTMLVSAAAGSGKTAVLVERVLQLLTDKENPCGIENLLIVTFTKAAASQMKDKISSKLSETIANDPSNYGLRLKKLMLPYSNICTIDSFCINLVRENFHTLNIAPDFQILDESKLKVLKSNAVNQVLDELYEENSTEFKALSELVNDEKDDKKLINSIISLYDLSRAYAFPEVWLDSLLDAYNEEIPTEKTEYGKVIIENSKSIIVNIIDSINYCIDCIDEEIELMPYKQAFLSDRNQFISIYDCLRNDSWDDIKNALSSYSGERLGSIRKYESTTKDLVKNIREKYKKELKTIIEYFDINSEDNKDDIKKLKPLIRKLIDCVKIFSEKFKELKSEENSLDFNDTLHLALDLLVYYQDGEIIKTDLAKELSKNYKEILVDEYQDVNKAQDLVFRALSQDDSNLFMVGDVKQSIYRFRQAMPDIFIELKEKYKLYDGKNYPAKVNLGMNFRSRKGITDIANFVFNQIMSKSSGGIDYTDEEYLVPGGDYSSNDEIETEVCLIECDKSEYTKSQARYIGRYIKNAIDKGMKVGNKGSEKSVTYKDFAILLRSVKDRAKIFVETLQEMGIPAYSDTDENFLETPEIAFLISLLKVIDNPINDIPLTAVLLSPVFGFTMDDISKLRIESRNGSIYSCVVKSAENGNQKSKDFLEKIKEFRNISVTLPSGEFISNLIDLTGYRAICGAMSCGEARISNLNMFIDTANKYESTGTPGISSFLRFLDKLIESKGTIKAKSKKTDVANAVTVITVHKSKGLEYPVCFLASCEKANNEMSLRSDMIISKQTGIGMKQTYKRMKYTTIPYIASSIETKNEEHSEELRILYVALTRPKEKLVILASSEDWDNKLKKIGSSVRKEPKFSPISVQEMKGFGDYLLSTLMKHPDAHALRNAAGLGSEIHLPCESRLKVNIIKDANAIIESENDTSITYEKDSELYDKIESALSYKYPYEGLNCVLAARAASDLDDMGFNEQYFASSKPDFISKGKLTAAQKGTITHKFMESLSFERIENNTKDISESINNELNILINKGIFTEEEAKSINIKAIESFFNSELSKELLSADQILREYSLEVAIQICDVYPDIDKNISNNEVIVVNGIVDCAFIKDDVITLVDYKTDNVTDENILKDRYSKQLLFYKKGLEMTTGLKVSDTYIWSFALNKQIKIS